MKAEIKRALDWFCYEPISWQKSLGYQVKTGNEACRASVHESGRGVGFNQCANKAKETVEGLRFCGLHAKKIRARLKELTA